MKSICTYLLCLLPLISSGQYFGQNKSRYKIFNFKVLQTKNFELYHYFKDKEVTDRILTNSEYWHSLHLSIFKKPFPKPNPLVIYQNHPDFQETTTIDGEIGEGTGGVTEAFKNRVVMPVMYSHRQTDHVLGHELVHAFQYQAILNGDSTSMNNLQNLPLWMVEGLAEFMSIGRDDPHTAMWMRDAVLNDDIPTLKDLQNPKYFPYRWGQAFWSYISGTYGDDKIYPLFMNTSIFGLEEALKGMFEVDSKKFSENWKQALIAHYKPLIQNLDAKAIGNSVATSKNAGDMNISPALSPNGEYLAYISEKNVISLDIFITNARTGKVVRRIGGNRMDGHIDSFSFLETAGTWSPDSRRFAIVVQSRGRNRIAIYDVNTGRKLDEFEVNGVPAFTNPAWSPDGEHIVVSGLVEGYSDLYAVNIKNRSVTNLTNDVNSDIMPTWSADGQYIYFVSDRNPATPRLEKAKFNLARLNVGTQKVDNLNIFPNSDNFNPVIDQTGNNLYFLSDQDGFRNLYRHNFQSNQTEQLTQLPTGISGITMYAPAISLAQKTDQLVYTYYLKGKYELYTANVTDFKPIEKKSNNRVAAILPPLQPLKGRSIVQANLEKQTIPPALASITPVEKPFKSNFKLDYVGSSGLGVGINNQFGTGLQGGVQALFSDIMGNRQLMGALALNGEIKDIGGQVAYLNQKRPFQWGFQASHIPYRISGDGYSLDTLRGTQNNKPVKVPVQKYSIYNERQFMSSLETFAYYPFSRSKRFEAGGGLNWINFSSDRIDQFYDYADQFIGEKRESLPAREGFNYQQMYAAYVGDNSSFGLTSPLDGYRYRFEARQIFGVATVTSYLADMRKYFFFKPFSLAGRLMMNRRDGPDATSNVMFPLFIGFPGLVHGYYGRSLDRQLQNGVRLDQLQGTRMIVANAELRMPFTGPKKLALIKSGLLFTDLFAFIDAGVAWSGDRLNTKVGREVTYTDGSTATEKFWYTPVGSIGAGARVNLFGYLIIEPYMAFPVYDQKVHGATFGLNFTPGW